MDKNEWNVNSIKRYKEFLDKRGTLIPFYFKDFPFEPKHMFYVTHVPDGTTRGEHAHKQSEQVLVCLSGEIDVWCFDGVLENHFMLVRGEAIWIPKMVWSSQQFFNGGSMLVVCSQEYNEKEYIRDYEGFLSCGSC